MPLFFFLSGYVSKNQASFVHIKKYFIALLIPFFSWAIISPFYYQSISTGSDIDILQNIKTTLVYPDHGLWFLYVLFVIHLLNYLKSKTSLIYVFVSLVVLMGLSYIIGLQNILGLKTIVIFSIYFFLGQYTNKHSSVSDPIFNKYFYIFLVLFIFFGYFWHRTDNVNLLSINLNALATFLYRYWVAFLGIFAFYGAFSFVDFNKLAYLGKHTLVIYILNSYFMPFLTWLNFSDFYIINLFFSTAIIITTSLIVEFFLEKTKLTSLVLLGKNKYSINAK